MATRFGNFKELSQGKKPITADEAYLMLKELGMLGNQFIPGAESLGMLLDGKSPKEAAMALQDWIPGNAAYQNWLNDRPQDWSRNAVDAAVMAVPAARGATKAAGAIERTFGGKLGPKAGFMRNPSFDWNKLTPAQKNATQGAIEEWSRLAKVFNAGPQTPPKSINFLDENINDAVMNVAGDYKFIKKLRGQPNKDIVTQAILPEHTGEAAFLRHSPYMSNYDKVLNSTRVGNEENALAKAGLLPYFEKEVYDNAGHYAKLFPTVEGSKSDIGKQAKATIIDNLEYKFPGYKNVMKGFGPGQKAYENTPSYQLNARTGDLDKYIKQQVGRMNDMPFDKAQDFYKAYAADLDDQIRGYQEAIDDFLKQPVKDQAQADKYIKQQKNKMKFWQKYRVELEKAFTEKSLNEL